MTALIFSLPDQHQDFAAARAVLRCEGSTRQQLLDACTVLSASHDWQDVLLVRDMLGQLGRPVAVDLGDNAALFAELNRRRRADRWGWIACAVGFAVLLAYGVM